jgi:hypothetical protein
MRARFRGSASGEHTRDRSVLVGKLAEILRGQKPARKVNAISIDMAFGSCPCWNCLMYTERSDGARMQVRKPLAALLSVVFTLPAHADTISIRELALGIQIGSTVEVGLSGKERPNKLRGQMGMIDNQAFDLVIGNSGGEPRSIPFGQVRSLRLVKRLRAKPGERSSTLEATAQAIPKGALVEVRFAGRQTPSWLRGRIGLAASQEFQIQVLQSGMIDVRTLRYAEVESIKPVDSLWVASAPAKVHGVIGAGVSIALTAVLVVAIVLAIAAKTGHLGG